MGVSVLLLVLFTLTPNIANIVTPNIVSYLEPIYSRSCHAQ